MATFSCDCGGPVDVDTGHLGAFASLSFRPPVRVVCATCIDRLGLQVQSTGGLSFVMRDGKEYRLLGGAFVRSENPQSVNLYYRDEK